MGKIELDHTGAGSGVTLSSDGTDLLLNGTAIGGGGGGSGELTFLEKTANYTITNGDLGKFIQNTTSSTITFDLPAVADISTGWYVYIQARSGECIIDSNISFGINFSTTFTLEKGSTAKVIFNGNTFYLFQEPSNVSLGGISLGDNAYASQNPDAIAIGKSTSATGSNSVAFGSSAVSAGSGSVSLRNSYASGTDSFAAAIANNTSSYGATGANSIAIGPTSKAEGPYAIAIGWANTAGNRSVVIGGNSTNAGDNSVGIGTWQSDIDGAYSAAIGGGKAHDHGVQNRWMYGLVSSPGLGKAQAGKFVLFAQTADETQTSLKTNGSATGGNNQIILGDNNMTWGFMGQIVARSTNQIDYAIWEVKGSVTRGTGVATTAIDVAIINPIYHTTAAAAWAVSIDPDTTYAAAKINVTGASATAIRWVANIDTTEVGT